MYFILCFWIAYCVISQQVYENLSFTHKYAFVHFSIMMSVHVSVSSENLYRSVINIYNKVILDNYISKRHCGKHAGFCTQYRLFLSLCPFIRVGGLILMFKIMEYKRDNIGHENILKIYLSELWLLVSNNSQSSLSQSCFACHIVVIYIYTCMFLALESSS